MKWTYIIAHKFKAALALLIVFLLVLATNLLDKHYFAQLQTSFTSVYEDRLVAENYLFNLSKYLHQKKQLFSESDRYQSAMNVKINDSIDTIIEKYEATKLTTEESQHFKSLKAHLYVLGMMENGITNQSFSEDNQLMVDVVTQYQLIWSDLEALSEIQLVEGKKLIQDSNRIITSSNLTSRFEIGVLMVIGLIIQALILSSKSVTSKFKQQDHLN